MSIIQNYFSHFDCIVWLAGRGAVVALIPLQLTFGNLCK